jgi:hypothetical protein
MVVGVIVAPLLVSQDFEVYCWNYEGYVWVIRVILITLCVGGVVKAITAITVTWTIRDTWRRARLLGSASCLSVAYPGLRE